MNIDLNDIEKELDIIGSTFLQIANNRIRTV